MSFSRLLQLSSVFCAMSFMVGCAQPPLVNTKDEMLKNIGKDVTFQGVYNVHDNGEVVRNEQGMEVMLDVSSDILGFGKPPIHDGSTVSAHGELARGVMLNGYYMEENLLSTFRGPPDNPVRPGFVLRDAKVGVLSQPGLSPATKPSSSSNSNPSK